MYLVISTSLHSDSRSRILARGAAAALDQKQVPHQYLDLSDFQLPPCDGQSCYDHQDCRTVAAAIHQAFGILIATPIYNYDVSSSAKNLIELGGQGWNDKVVGLLCAAGGSSSYMAPMGLANSLMLDFRTLILPRFVYVTGESFAGPEICDPDCHRRIAELVGQLIRICTALSVQP